MENSQLDTVVESFCSTLMNAVPEFMQLYEATKALESDMQAMQVWKEKEERRQTIELLKAQGLPVSEDQEVALQRSLGEVRENRICMEYLRSTNQAKKIAGIVGNKLQEIMGVSFGPRKGC